ncbi:MAG: hypothetical protein STHCBS139747_004834 [Sporothrix thermara]
MNQRRARRESKRAKADLEEKLQLIAEGRHTELNRRLMDENKALRGALQQLRAKVESTFLHMKDCVDDGDELMADLIAQSSRRGASSEQHRLRLPKRLYLILEQYQHREQVVRDHAKQF